MASSIQDASAAISTTISDVRLDKAKMSATAVINTPDCDREGEVILAEGIDFGNYRKNPVVLWEHGVAGLTLPIASSENPDDGSLAISVSGGVIEGTSYFTNKLRESEQIYDLICDGIIRATSIHVIPRKAPIQRTLNSGRLVSVYDESEMLEWSWCMYGVNPQAVRKALSAKVAGRRLAPSLMKSFRQSLARSNGKENQFQRLASKLAMIAERLGVSAPSPGDSDYIARCERLLAAVSKHLEARRAS